jgi:transposase InsO family protein
MIAGIVVEALEHAWRRGYVAGNAIFHSDRGSQYAGRILARRDDERGARLSVGRTGSCHDIFWHRCRASGRSHKSIKGTVPIYAESDQERLSSGRIFGGG